jgi:hypothetical protein
VVGDAAYTNGSLMKRRPANVHLIGRSRPDAALYAPAPRHRGRGRPRVRGARVRSPAARAARKDARWQRVEVTSNKTTTLGPIIDVWYVAAGRRYLPDVRGFRHDKTRCIHRSRPPPGRPSSRFSECWPLRSPMNGVG